MDCTNTHRDAGVRQVPHNIYMLADVGAAWVDLEFAEAGGTASRFVTPFSRK